MPAIPAIALRPPPTLINLRQWCRAAARRLRDAGTSYPLDPHLVADTGLTEVRVPLLPRRQHGIQGGTPWTA